MSARDELAALIADHFEVEVTGEYDACAIWATPAEIADAILAAGYSKPHTITTAEELDALPEGTAIVDKCERMTLEETSLQCLEWVDRHGNACHVELPALVLPEPTP